MKSNFKFISLPVLFLFVFIYLPTDIHYTHLAPNTSIYSAEVSPDALVAFGGNAFGKGTPSLIGEAYWNSFETEMDLATEEMADLVMAGKTAVFAHGNGPQVGHEFCLYPEIALADHTETTQREMGKLLREGLLKKLKTRGFNNGKVPEIVVVPTHVRVSRNDPSFQNPSKPIGWFTKEKAEELRDLFRAKGGAADIKLVKPKDPDKKGWRVLVPSPEPLEIVEIDEIRRHIAEGKIVIACGGGGIPVDESGNRVDAVIDKDRASALLAIQLNTKLFAILTATKQVAENFGSENAKGYDQLNAADSGRLLSPGILDAGSIRPKVESVEKTRKAGIPSLITQLGNLSNALKRLPGEATWFDPDINESPFDIAI